MASLPSSDLLNTFSSWQGIFTVQSSLTPATSTPNFDYIVRRQALLVNAGLSSITMLNSKSVSGNSGLLPTSTLDWDSYTRVRLLTTITGYRLPLKLTYDRHAPVTPVFGNLTLLTAGLTNYYADAFSSVVVNPEHCVFTELLGGYPSSAPTSLPQHLIVDPLTVFC